MDRQKKSLIIKIISTVISFILSFLVFADVSLIIAKSQILSSSALISSMDKTNYYGQLSSEIEDDFVSYGLASGFPDKFFEDTIDFEIIKYNIIEQTEKMYSGKYSTFDESEIYNSMYEDFIKYANDNNYEVTDEIDKNIKYLARTCAEHYVECIDIPFSSAISPYIPKLSKFCLYGIIFCTIGVLVCVAVLLLIQSWKHRSIRYYIYSLTTAGLMLFIFPIVIYASGKITKVAVLSQAMHDLIVVFLQSFLNSFFLAGIVDIIVIGILLFVHNSIRTKLKHSH